MYVCTSKGEWKQPFFRSNEELQPNDESLANAKSLDDNTANPVPESSMELSGKLKQSIRNKRKTRRGYGKKKDRKINKGNTNQLFSLIGTNAAGLNCKRESFFRLINKYRPSIITVQESKLSKPGLIKIPGYQTFERIRKSKKGGGLLTAAVEDLNPVLIGSSDDTEVLTIQVDVGIKKIRIINGYGPQEDDDIKDILNFWQNIEAEVVKAKDENCMIIIEMDANAKVGHENIQNDPHTITNNGKLLVDLMSRQNLTMLNATDFCTGTITRERKAGNKTEQSVIDYMIVCQEMLEYVQEMIIDEERDDVLTNYQIKKKDKNLFLVITISCVGTLLLVSKGILEQ